jgi:hypothetical protein
MFLNDAELRQLTGYRRPSAQRAWLKLNAVPYCVALSGYPVVDGRALLHAHGLASGEARPTLLTMPAYSPLVEIRGGRQHYRVGSGPVGPGVYFLFLRWALTYVGQSNNIAARLRAHHKGRQIPFNKFFAIGIPVFWLDKAEAFYIERDRPPFNIKGIPRA